MPSGAGTPEELETLLEDAFVTRDGEALAQLFEEGAVLTTRDELHAYAADDIARVAASMWDAGRTYLADPRAVLQVRDAALVLAERATNVVRRGSDGHWQYAIALLAFDDPTKKEEP